MAISVSSPTLRSRDRAPEPSAALLALQQKGLELPLHRNTSTPISPESNPTYDRGPQVSPLSILSTSSNFHPSPAPPREPEAIEFAWRRRTCSTASVETTVTGILNLYTNLSKQSLKSEYEEITPYPDSGDESEEDAPPLPLVHQPKAQAYRDTIAPLLEHQFSNSNLMVPGSISPGLSPMSLASMPMLMHPDASLSVPSLRLTPDRSIGRKSSITSIQITPEMSPMPVLSNSGGATSDLNEKRIVLEVPDVRDADSWYDQPLSPVSPEDLEYRNAIRDSQQSAVSPQSPTTQTNHFRSLAFESLSPPSMNVKMSPGLRSVKVVDGDQGMIPLPLDLNRSRTLLSRGSTPAHQTEITTGPENEQGGTRSHHPSLMLDSKTKGDFIDSPLIGSSRPLEQRMSYMTETSNGDNHLSLEEIYRPGSAFSDSSDSYVIHDTLSGQVRAMWRDKFGNKKDKKRKSKEGEWQSVRRSKGKEKDEKMRSGPTMTKNAVTAFSDEVGSYRYPYNLAHTSLSDAGEQRGTDSRREIRSTSTTYDTRPSTGDEPRPLRHHRDISNDLKDPTDPSTHKQILEYPAIPLTRYQKYGVEIWYESNKKKRRQEREKARKEAEKAERQAREATQQAVEFGMISVQKALPDIPTTIPMQPSSSLPDPSRPGFYRQAQHAHNASNGSTAGSSTQSTDIDGGDASSRYSYGNGKQRRSVGKTMGSSTYNNALFEASGGEKKKSGFASRLMMSSEEKRKKKVKESITILGGKRMGGDGDGSELGGCKGLVRI